MTATARIKSSIPTGNNFKALSDERCGKCHDDRLEHYRETYHGKAMMLGKPNSAPEVAACYDCHGFHDVLPVVQSRVAPVHQQHSGDLPEMSSGRDGEIHRIPAARQPARQEKLSAAARRVPGDDRPAHRHVRFFGLHTLAWLVRAVWLYLHDSKTFREAKIKTQEGDEWFTRFVPFERFLHFLVVTSFLTARRHRHAAEILLHRLGEIYFQRHRRAGNGADAAPLWRHHHVPVFHAALEFARRQAWKGRGNLRNPETGKIEIKRFFSVLFGPDSMVPTMAGLAQT